MTGTKELRDTLFSIYSDTYKEIYNIRPTWEYKEFMKLGTDSMEDKILKLTDEVHNSEELGLMEWTENETSYTTFEEATMADAFEGVM